MAVRNYELDPKIIKAAKEEFLKYGYNKASLRNIAKNSNITTGALYTRYKSKDDLFESLIKNSFTNMPFILQPVMELYNEAKGEKDVKKFIEAIKKEEEIYLDILFKYYDECVLLICKSEGSRLDRQLKQMMSTKSNETINFFKEIANKEIDFDGIALIMSEQFSYYRLILEKGYSKEKAVSVMKTVDKFIEAGWMKIFNEII